MRVLHAVSLVGVQHLEQFVALAVGRHVREQVRVAHGGVRRRGVHAEARFRRYAYEPHEPQSVRREHRVGVVSAHDAPLDVAQAAEKVVDLARAYVHVQAVDGEVAPLGVLAYVRVEFHLDGDVSPAGRVLLRAEGRVLHLRLVVETMTDERRSHALVRRGEIEPARQSERLGQRLPRHVDVRGRQSAERVTDIPAHDVKGRVVERREFFQPLWDFYLVIHYPRLYHQTSEFSNDMAHHCANCSEIMPRAGGKTRSRRPA